MCVYVIYLEQIFTPEKIWALFLKDMVNFKEDINEIINKIWLTPDFMIKAPSLKE